MIDIHCHILPEFDDGSKSKQMSVEMCRMAAESGVSDIVATPHTYNLFDTAEYFERYRARMQYMHDKLNKERIPVKIHKGAEVHVTDDFFHNPDFGKFTLGKSEYILIEYSFSRCTLEYAVKAVEAVKAQGLVPVIAHPERYLYTVKDYDFVNRLAEHGVHFQVNLGSVIGELGKEQMRLAKEIVNNGMASFLASDAHRTEFRNTDFTRMLACLPKDIDTSDFDNLLTNNAAEILSGKRISLPDYTRIEKKSFFQRLKK